MRESLVERAVQYLRSRPEVEIAYVFGSQVSQRTTPLSDIDIAVYLREDGLPAFRALLTGLSQHLDSQRVDLIPLTHVPPTFAHQVVARGRLIFCRDPHHRVAYEAQVTQQMLDFAPLKAHQYAYLKRRTREGRMGEQTKDWIDRRAVLERIGHINKMLGYLKRHRHRSVEEFLADEEAGYTAVYELQTALEAVADIGNHIIAAVGLGMPHTREEIMRILGRAGVLPPELAERLGLALRMRNVLVHGYLEVVIDQVYQAIQEDLGDLEAFCQAILNYVEAE